MGSRVRGLRASRLTNQPTNQPTNQGVFECSTRKVFFEWTHFFEYRIRKDFFRVEIRFFSSRVPLWRSSGESSSASVSLFVHLAPTCTPRESFGKSWDHTTWRVLIDSHERHTRNQQASAPQSAKKSVRMQCAQRHCVDVWNSSSPGLATRRNCPASDRWISAGKVRWMPWPSWQVQKNPNSRSVSTLISSATRTGQHCDQDDFESVTEQLFKHVAGIK